MCGQLVDLTGGRVVACRAWEAEALPAPYLREALEDKIKCYVDVDAIKVIEAEQASEREGLHEIAATARGER